MKQLTAFLSVLLYTTLAFAHSDSTICYLRDIPGRIREHNVDFEKMVLEVNLLPKDGVVQGKVSYCFRPIQPLVDTLFLDAPGTTINKATLDGGELKHKSNEQGVTFYFPKSLNWRTDYNLKIDYTCTPRKGLYFIGWNVDVPKDTEKNPYLTRKQVWTQGQGIDNRHWIPSYDDVNDKMLIETIITFDSTYTVISNGTLKSKKANGKGQFTWHYAMNKPMVPYLIMLAIDRYNYKDYRSKNGIVSRQYYYADRPETVVPTYRYSAEMMDWMPAFLNVPYPWQTYANVPVQDFMFGAMENTTATIFGDFYLMDERGSMERSYVATNAHELTHQWFGDYITEYSGTHHWLHESFATYYAKHFIRHVQGEDAYVWNKRGEANSAIFADKNDRFPVASSQGGSARHYPKGSIVIDMLRYVVGDSVYQRSVANYLKKHAYGNVTTHDFLMTFMETSGMNLDWFFDQWVYRAGVPNFNVRYQRKNELFTMYIDQTHKTDGLTAYFKMPVYVDVFCKNGKYYRFKKWLTGPSDTLIAGIDTQDEIDFTLFDPGFEILKVVDFYKPFEEVQAQLLRAPHMIDRYDALLLLENTEIEKKRDLLLKAFEQETFYATKNEILSQLAKDNHPTSRALFSKALTDTDFLVRRQALEKTDSLTAESVQHAIRMLQDSSYINVETALRKLSKQYPERTDEFIASAKDVVGINNNIRIACLELQYARNPEKTQAIEQLVRYTSNWYEFRTRTRAMEALERLNYLNESAALNMLEAITNPNGRLSWPAKRHLKKLSKTEASSALAEKVYKSNQWADWQKTILDKYFTEKQ